MLLTKQNVYWLLRCSLPFADLLFLQRNYPAQFLWQPDVDLWVLFQGHYHLYEHSLASGTTNCSKRTKILLDIIVFTLILKQTEVKTYLKHGMKVFSNIASFMNLDLCFQVQTKDYSIQWVMEINCYKQYTKAKVILLCCLLRHAILGVRLEPLLWVRIVPSQFINSPATIVVWKSNVRRLRCPIFRVTFTKTPLDYVIKHSPVLHRDV